MPLVVKEQNCWKKQMIHYLIRTDFVIVPCITKICTIEMHYKENKIAMLLFFIMRFMLPVSIVFRSVCKNSKIKGLGDKNSRMKCKKAFKSQIELDLWDMNLWTPAPSYPVMFQIDYL